MKSGRARNSAGLVASTLNPWATDACIPMVPLALWMMARSTIEMNGLTIMLATAAAATSLSRRAARMPRAPTRAKRLTPPRPPTRAAESALALAEVVASLPLLAAKKPLAAVAPAAAAAAAAAT